MNELWRLVEKEWRSEPPKARPNDELALDHMRRGLVDLDTSNIWDELDDEDDEDDED
ncbi:hypothetical protein [Exiguobacterium sp. BMC-KP]|uniref:hypothetical protein n=1 Tax=Exiguobacterium sp. BMC-KP TaxID=1684312 RepID=UPI000A42F7E3|nr:hypothetical protein [Exiguobacterium sp. BMC-KP]